MDIVHIDKAEKLISDRNDLKNFLGEIENEVLNDDKISINGIEFIARFKTIYGQEFIAEVKYNLMQSINSYIDQIENDLKEL
jgi:hypothetical protein